MTHDLLIYDALDHISESSRSPPLQKVVPALRSEIEPEIDVADEHASTKNRTRLRPVRDPVNASLLVHFAPDCPDLSGFDPLGFEADSEADGDSEIAMTAPSVEHEQSHTVGVDSVPAKELLPQGAAPARSMDNLPVSVDARALKDQANAVLEHSAILATQQHTTSSTSSSTNQRGPDDDSLSGSEKRQRSGRWTPLKLRTQRQPPPTIAPKSEETITASPNLSKHVIPVAEGADTTLPAMQPALLARDGTASSPQAEKLPPLHQITSGMQDALNAFADVATSQDPRSQTPSHHHSHSFGSATAHSPTILFSNFAGPQASPPGHYVSLARSPPSAASEPFYGSPTQRASSAYYADRRTSAQAEHVPRLPPSLPSASSSGESLGHASSTTDGGYSTSRTTPSEFASTTGSTPKPMMLPPPPPHTGMPTTGFKCDFEGCNAPLFQTQYLLSSHKNVHSEDRSHFCPYPNCARGEGGRGFKRKNEMIRHQLVHKSPGYMCPFCPEREHKYPRPDNLQRHVRVHHVDKERDDPQLCEVLAKRNGGAGKARRRRALSSSM